MTRERILATQPDGSVHITCPSEWGIAALMYGGAWDDRWPGFWIGQVMRMVARGVPSAPAYRYARMMMTGGATRREAIEIIRDRDCRGSAIEIVDVSEIPEDRTHRNAWRRSSNGGPIWIDEQAAQSIDEQRLWSAYEGQR
jgi:hypothetical protein